MSVNFNSLWNNYSNTKNKVDVTGDGKYNSKDSTQLSKEKTALLKEVDVFDITGDGNVTQDDLDMMVNGFDIDGDGKISDIEKSFEKTYLSNMVSQMKKTDETFVYNNRAYSNGKTYTGEYQGLMYKNGTLLTGVVDNKYYKKGVVSEGTYGGKLYDVNGLVNGLVTQTVNKKEVTYMYKDGVKATGEIEGKYYANGSLKTGNVTVKENGKNVTYYYSNGEKAQGKVGNYVYKDGLKYTGVAEDGLYYANGLLKTGNITDGSTITNYKKGEFQYSVTDNNAKDYPNQSSKNIRFKNGTKYANVKLEIGSSAVINEDGTVEITDKDSKKVKYDSTGNIIEDTKTTPEPEPMPEPEPTPDPVTPDPVIPTGTEYSLGDSLKTITVGGKEITLNISPYLKGKIIVEDSGKINIYIDDDCTSTGNIDFTTDENLNIEVKQCKNENFGLLCGNGNDNVVIAEGVKMFRVSGWNGDDTIVNNGYLDGDIRTGEGADTIINNGNIYDINAGNGNDTITNNGTVRNSIHGDNGDDTITNNGSSEYLSGDNGNDRIINNKSGKTNFLNGNDGNDILINYGYAKNISGSYGNDTIQNYGDASNINGDSGDDTIINELTGIVINSIHGNLGNDTIINNGVVKNFISGDEGSDSVTNNGIVGQNMTGGGDKGDVVKNNGKAKYVKSEKSDDTVSEDTINKYSEKAKNIRDKYDGDIKNFDGHNILEDFWKWLKDDVLGID